MKSCLLETAPEKMVNPTCLCGFIFYIVIGPSMPMYTYNMYTTLHGQFNFYNIFKVNGVVKGYPF